MSLTSERLRERLRYDEKTGLFARLMSSRGRKYEKPTGSINKISGYVVISLDHEWYYAHRLAWFWMHGVWPEGEIDHIDLNRSNNAKSNLRPASKTQQRSNQRVRKDSSLGVKGIHRVPSGRYRVTIGSKYHSTHDTIEEASAAYAAAAEKKYGEYARSE